MSASAVETREHDPLTFAIKRFMHDLKEAAGVTVAWTTHSRYISLDPENPDSLIPEPPQDPRDTVPKSVVPAIGLVGPTPVQRNQVDYSAHQPTPEVTFVNRDGFKVSGVEVHNPPWVVDVSFEINIFHTRQFLLWQLVEKIRRYFFQNPYLVIPADKTDVEGLTILNHAQFIDDYWSFIKPDRSGLVESRDAEGTVISQRLPHDAPLFTSTRGSNDDNLFVTDSAVLLQNISLPDGCVVGRRVPFERFEFDFFDRDDTTELPLIEAIEEGEET